MGLYTGVLHTGVSEALELSSKIADVHLFPQIIMYFDDFRATWAYTRWGGLYTGVSEALELSLIFSFFLKLSCISMIFGRRRLIQGGGGLIYEY